MADFLEFDLHWKKYIAFELSQELRTDYILEFKHILGMLYSGTVRNTIVFIIIYVIFFKG